MNQKNLYRILHRKSIESYGEWTPVRQAVQRMADIFANTIQNPPVKLHSKKIKCTVTVGARWNDRLGARSLKGVQYSVRFTDAEDRDAFYILLTDPYLIDFFAEDINTIERTRQIKHLMMALESPIWQKIKEYCAEHPAAGISRIALSGVMAEGYIDFSFAFTMKNPAYAPAK